MHSPLAAAAARARAHVCYPLLRQTANETTTPLRTLGSVRREPQESRCPNVMRAVKAT